MSRPLTELCKLARKYGCDKGGVLVPYPNERRHCFTDYTPIYNDLFEHRRGDIMRVAEIGIWEGRSLRMWAEYFGNAQVDGFDRVNEKLIQENRIRTFWADQNSEQTLNHAWEEAGWHWDYDFICDDGGHEYHQNVNTMKVFLPRLRCGGIYVIEDNIGFPDVTKDVPSGYSIEVIRWPNTCRQSATAMLQIIRKPGDKWWDAPPAPLLPLPSVIVDIP